MKKILFVITKSNWGGAQRYVFDLATSLPKNTFDVRVAYGGTGKQGASAGVLEERLRSAGIPTLFIRSFARDMHLWAEISAFFELLRLFKKERPDTVHLNSSKAGGIGAFAARIAGVRNIVFTSHGLAWDEDRNIFARALIYTATWATFLLCHAVITLSCDNYERARRCWPCAGKIHLIYNGIPPLQFEDRDSARMLLQAHITPTLGPDICLIGAISELTRNKGLSYLIRAAGMLKKQSAPFQVCIIGDGEDRLALETLAEEELVSDRVHFIGFVPEAYRFLTAFDIFTLASVKEGLPYVLLEAGAAHVAVVGSKIPGITDILGETGLMIPPRDSVALAEKLRSLIVSETDRKTCADFLSQRIAQRFPLERMVTETTALYSLPENQRS